MCLCMRACMHVCVCVRVCVCECGGVVVVVVVVVAVVVVVVVVNIYIRPTHRQLCDIYTLYKCQVFALAVIIVYCL